MRRPLDSYRVTGDTKEHASYGVGPATDYAAEKGGPLPIGTPVKAPFPLGKVEYWGDDSFPGGLAVTATSPDKRFVFVGQHLSGSLRHPGLAEGSVIAYSGNSGTKTTGPHLHAYVIADGKRMSMEEAIKKYGLTKPVKVTKGTALRRVRKGVNGRKAPNLSARIVQFLKPGIVGTFDGWARGQKVTQGGVTSDVWYRGAFSGDWFWAGNFTTQSTRGLTPLGKK